MYEDRGGANDVFERLEGVFFLVFPFPFVVDSGEVVERSCNFCKSFDEASIEIAEPNEFSYSSYILGWFPFFYRFYFDLFHFETIFGEFYSQEIDLWLMEFTLFGVQGNVGGTTMCQEFAVDVDVFLE